MYKKILMFIFFFSALFIYAQEKYLFTSDNYFNEKPKTILNLRLGLGASIGSVANNDNINLHNYSLNSFKLLANIYPNSTIVKGFFLNGDFSFRVKPETQNEVLDITTFDFSLGPQIDGGHIKYLGDLEYYFGPAISVGIYNYVSDIKNENWYFNTPPIGGFLYGAVGGVELFFSKLLSAFVQIKFLTGRMQNVFENNEIYIGNNGDATIYNFDIPKKDLNLFEINIGARFYYGQNLGYTPFFFGFFEKN